MLTREGVEGISYMEVSGVIGKIGKGACNRRDSK